MKMLLPVLFIITIFQICFMEMAGAQDTFRKAYILTGLECGVPVGDLSDRCDWAFGGMIEVDHPLIDQLLFITPSIGFLSFYNKNTGLPNSRNLQLLPFQARLKIFPADYLYLAVSVGVGFLFNKYQAGYDKGTVFIYSPQIGYQLKAGRQGLLDLGLNFRTFSRFSTGGAANDLFSIKIAYCFVR